MPQPLAAPLTLAALLLLGACASPLSPVQPPAVSVANVGLASLGLFEQELRLDLRVKNPNRFGLDVEGVRFDLELAGDAFAEGFTNAGFELPAFGETVVPVTVNVPTNKLIDRLMAFGFGRTLDYRLTGEVVLASRFLPGVPFSREGELTLPRVPGLSARGS